MHAQGDCCRAEGDVHISRDRFRQLNKSSAGQQDPVAFAPARQQVEAHESGDVIGSRPARHVQGVPTWTTFAGRLGAVDRQLVEEGRLRLLERVEDLEVVRRDREWHSPRAIADAVVEEILRA